jgi:hypothetical protein
LGCFLEVETEVPADPAQSNAIVNPGLDVEGFKPFAVSRMGDIAELHQIVLAYWSVL